MKKKALILFMTGMLATTSLTGCGSWKDVYKRQCGTYDHRRDQEIHERQQFHQSQQITSRYCI